MSNSLDPDQAENFVWPDLDSICLQRLSVDNTGKQRELFINRVWPTCGIKGKETQEQRLVCVFIALTYYIHSSTIKEIQ